ncbi:polyribonucleotide nucleotidyltransferase [Schwartzia succinivorans]|jgi:polyribonucleotide nucleotidyltransferase|uniref:Polyribonucleotide nucleotidyltransferase n=1 Tax=Schwartzia succinivorans DSM 10502 TaxID=1123243 RepID=A0A1M4V7K9_9FIRM|nr:polyribonucleotide nucleotidyltransferase [Schwartzia succinivorans]MBQ1918211.1 polyribonucleotide nucleotidyltransferase [Schwartzia sp. (in: firmicutes)]MBQ2047975.1 polyribonucleotide nucleotidyltransferase [Schwartzia sp. (in: firmicutes)]MBQ3862414.1 polyribonucleotide nucleotidyltransferase [Schwartzia sp. (in: firmicutes)]MBQ5413564.1 polyribonucleotide nucleotidyltransferase [Schwartzia sp. (in: firmicutes)]MCR5447363.1 polyribonucleotide nucleotidyltransferase [Schwartzia sp. (in:
MQSFEMEVGGRSFVIENGKMAKQANGAVLVRYGDTVVLVTATASKEPREGVDFFPLTVDYEEKMYAVGKIPGGFIKREGRPGNSAILCARLIDRPIRPLFNKGFRNDVQIVATVMSVEQDNPPEIAAMIGASCALCVSDIPFNGPIAGVRVGRVDGKFVINPTVEQRKVSDLNLTVAGSHDAVMMVEAGANELPEDVVLEAILFGHKEIQRIVEFQRDIMAACGKEKREMKLFEIPEALEKGIREYAAERLDKAVRNPDKLQRDEDIAVVNADTMEHFLVEYPDNAKEIAQVLHDVEKDIVRHMITHEKIRPDGRALDEVRPVSCEVGILPRAHGSGLFTRGQTQILTVTTLGSLSDEQVLDGLGTEKSKRYIHQYNFPGYSVGEARPIRSPGRREIGHGALAERALVPVIPSEEEFPYTLRLVSEVLESNGSSSMGSVCGSTLSLMHAGVPIKRPVAGVAMGLVKEGDEYTILTDIQGMEDALGDMDFKVAGTEVGVTAIQMDIKIAGITREILSSALAQAKRGREFIMGKMMECISEPAADLSPYAPRVTTMHIKTDKIRTVIGPGGKMIKKIVDETGTQIDIEEDGTIRISATDQDAAKKAVAIIEDLVREVEVGAVYKGRVTRTMTFGAFVEVLPGKEGLCHISQLAKERVEKVEDVVNVGDELEVKVTEIDRQGRVNLSHKVLL